MGWFWATESTPQGLGVTYPASSTPPPQPKCPVDHSSRSGAASPSTCPVHPESRSRWAFNVRNSMPSIPNEPLNASKHAALPTSREMSTIPMNEQGEVWQYPSPQQMLNAMSRKGYDGTNPEDVPAMVAVHNWLNEGSWEEILRWEKQYFPDNDNPHLVKFSGRPQRPTPKSYILWKTGRSPKAFDHHEWFVSTSMGKPRRYVIDYYSVDELTFSVDVRPALDDFSSIKARAIRFAENMKGKVVGNDGKDE